MGSWHDLTAWKVASNDAISCKLSFSRNHNNIVDLLHVSFIPILIHQFLIDGPVNILFSGYVISLSFLVRPAPVKGMIVDIYGLGGFVVLSVMISG